MCYWGVVQFCFWCFNPRKNYNLAYKHINKERKKRKKFEKVEKLVDPSSVSIMGVSSSAAIPQPSASELAAFQNLFVSPKSGDTMDHARSSSAPASVEIFLCSTYKPHFFWDFF